MAVDINDDVQAALVARWDATEDLVAVAGTLKAGRLPSPQPAVYAHVLVEKGRDNERMTGGIYHDYRNVTLTVRGKKASVVSAMAIALGVFNNRLGVAGQATLTMPSGARFIRFRPLNDGDKRLEETQKDGEEIWAGSIRAEIWSVRED